MVRLSVTERAQPRLLEATFNDARIVFDLRNDPFIVALGQSGKSVLWDEHLRWFKHCLESPDLHRIYLITIDALFCCVLRFDRKNTATATVSIYLRQTSIGRGIGVRAIKLGCELIANLWPIKIIEAFVVSGNTRSERAFRRAGFQADIQQQAGQTFVLSVADLHNGPS
ncbi:MAG TPA: GNAT family protein [Afipia sp.]